MKLLDLVFALIAIGSILSPSAEGIETTKFCDVVAFNDIGTDENYTIPLFDPAQGELVGVDLAVDLVILQNFSLENEAPKIQNLSVNSEAILSITLPDTASISVNASSSLSEKLAAYDGETDFGGSSGKMIEKVKSEGYTKEKCTNLSDFIAASQNEVISLPVALDVSSKTRGNIVSIMSTSAESKICISYEYEPIGFGKR